MLFFQPTPMAIIWEYELLASSVISIIIPQKWLGFLNLIQADQQKSNIHEEKIRHLVEGRLKQFSSAIYDIFETVTVVSKKINKINNGNLNKILDTAIDRGCRRCQKKMTCWGDDYGENFDRLIKVLPKLEKLGKVKVNDMPAEFISKCTKKEEITDAVNMAYDDYLFRRQMEKKMAALRKKRM